MTPAEPIEETTEQQPGEPTAPDYGKDNAKLPTQLIEAIRAAIKEFQEQDKFSRRREIRRDRRNRFYEAGYQHLLWNNTGNAGFAQLVPGSSVTNGNGGSIQCPEFMDAYEIFFPYFRIIQSVLTQNLPGVDFQPIDPSNPDDTDKAKAAEDYSALFDRMNDVPEIQAQIVRMFGMSGRCVSWTRTEQDAQRFGFEADGITAKRFQRTTIHGTLETKVPITAKELDQSCLYTFIYEDPDVKQAKSDYPDFEQEIKAGETAPGENQYERTARLGVLSGTKGQNNTSADTLSHLVTRMHGFLRPAAFTGALYDNKCDDDPTCTVKEKLNQLFPEGVRAVWVGDKYVASFAESMDDHLCIQWPYQGDGMFRQAFMDAMVVVQDNFNDLCNWIRGKIDTGAGCLWVNGEQEEVDAITSQKASPNAVRAAKMFAITGRPIEESFYKEPDPEIPDTLFKLLEFLRGALPEFILAALPALQGGQMSDNKTASGYAQANAQAKGQMAIMWARIQRIFARIRYQSALAASREDNLQSVTVPGGDDGQNIVVNMENLKKGQFGCYPDSDSTFPESTAAKRAIIEGLIEASATNPMIAQLLDNPDNVEEIQRIQGLSEMVFLPAIARDKQLHEIEQLLQQAPLPPSPEEMQAAMVQHAAGSIASQASGQPEAPPPDAEAMLKPSVPVDELDYHQWEFQKCQEWLSSPARRQEDDKGNSQGVLNVKLHALEHRKFMMAMAAQAAAMQPAPAAAGHAGPPKPGQPGQQPQKPATPPQPIAA